MKYHTNPERILFGRFPFVEAPPLDKPYAVYIGMRDSTYLIVSQHRSLRAAQKRLGSYITGKRLKLVPYGQRYLILTQAGRAMSWTEAKKEIAK